MNPNNNITDELLFSYLCGSCSEAKRLEVEQWLAEDKHHRARLDKMLLLFNATEPAETTSDANTAWLQLNSRLTPTTKSTEIKPLLFKRVAAIALLLIASGGLYFLAFHQPHRPSAKVAAVSIPTSTLKENTGESQSPSIPSASSETPPVQHVKKEVVALSQKRNPGLKDSKEAEVASGKKEEICNNTGCPLEICIVQEMGCEDRKETVSHCSILQPDASGVLHYKDFNAAASDCRSKIEEIRITKTNTGETILLNNQSSPITAQEFFDYMTGFKTGNIVAGNFESGCENTSLEQSIRLDNRLGMPVIH